MIQCEIENLVLFHLHFKKFDWIKRFGLNHWVEQMLVEFLMFLKSS